MSSAGCFCLRPAPNQDLPWTVMSPIDSVSGIRQCESRKSLGETGSSHHCDRGRGSSVAPSNHGANRCRNLANERKLAFILPAPDSSNPPLHLGPGKGFGLHSHSPQKEKKGTAQSPFSAAVSVTGQGSKQTSWMLDKEVFIHVSRANKTRSQASSTVWNPHAHDVLFGRGNNAKCHIGNIHYNNIVILHKLVFCFSSIKERKLLALRVVSCIERLNPPGRFLKWDDKAKNWYVVNHKEVLKKTKQALREDAPRLTALVEPTQEKLLDAGDEYLRLVREYMEENTGPQSKDKKRTFDDILDQLKRDLEEQSSKKKKAESNPLPLSFEYSNVC